MRLRNYFFVSVGVVIIIVASWRLLHKPLNQQPLSITSDCNDEEGLELAALHVLNPVLGYGPSSVAFELGYGDESKLNAQRELIAEYRQRVEKMDAPACVRAAYGKWLDFWQRENDEARSEMISGAKRREWLEYQRRRDVEQKAVESRSLVIPKP